MRDGEDTGQPDDSEADLTRVVDPDAGATFTGLPAVERGDQISRYVVVGRVGAGGMGDVYAAYDPELDRKVALKLLPTDRRATTDPDEAEARLLREAQAMAKLSHPNVVAVHDAGTFEGHVFIAMEYVEGVTLKQWLAAEPRRWDEVFEVMLPAARGLAGAHQAGIIHRDFKPANVMIREDGAVRVLDFGLARRLSAPTEPKVPSTSLVDSHDALAEHLTRTGMVAGTPAYMAPEQFSGADQDERTDQFSYCVALYEALYGERPFEGGKLETISKAVRTGKFRPVPSGSKVPARLRRCVMRGLSPDPAKRYPSMLALVEALRTAGRSPWRRAAPWGAAAVGIGLATAAIASPAKEPLQSPCADASTQLDGTWDDDARQAGQLAFAGVQLDYAADSWDKVQTRIDDYAERWTAQYADACEATRIHREQSEDLMDRRMVCLQARRVELDALADMLSTADAAVVEKAVEIVGKLSGLEGCTAAGVLADEVAPPPEAKAEAVAELSADLARTKVLLAARLVREIGGATEVAVTRARELDYAPVLGRALMQHGTFLMWSGQFDDAAGVLEESLLTAEATGDDDLEFRNRVLLTSLTGAMLARADEGLHHAKFARAVSQRLTLVDDMVGTVDLVEGLVEYRRGEYARARSLLEASLRDRVAELGENHEGVAMVLTNLGAVVVQLGDHEGARSTFERSLKIAEEVYGPRHPIVATTLNNLSLADFRLGRFEDAKKTAARAVEIWEASLPAMHPDTARGLHNLGAIEGELGKHDVALRHYERALQIKLATVGAEDPSVALTESNVADTLNELGRSAQALPHAETAIVVMKKRFGDDHPDLGGFYATYATALLATGRRDEAVPVLEDAMRILDANPGLVADRAEAQTVYARALWTDPAMRGRARELASEAREAFGRLGAGFGGEQREVDAWLAEHPWPSN